jgi:hypothetical protein
VSRSDADADRDRLERAFFAGENARLAREPSFGTERERQREALCEVVRVQDRGFLDRLVTLGIRPSTAVALRVVPLVFVAWADGALDDRERRAIEESARRTGLAAERISKRMLEAWLARRPDPTLLEAWKTYVRRLWGFFTAEERWQMRQNLLGAAREVADAAGGILGLTSRISSAERRVLEELGQVLD